MLSATCFEPRGSRTHSPPQQTAHADACKTYRTAYTAVSMSMNPWCPQNV